eukprot:TRINITY_DN16014_c0_g1_i1.p1 TRINITY_DN16014_c0_g1~~TRINITY_DN16014_c0_g1_i1.p1  ORF type:complete len:214 (+),score=45.31 TRINITY_DN16014_c0_g1_i1:213-854(+)
MASHRAVSETSSAVFSPEAWPPRASLRGLKCGSSIIISRQLLSPRAQRRFVLHHREIQSAYAAAVATRDAMIAGNVAAIAARDAAIAAQVATIAARDATIAGNLVTVAARDQEIAVKVEELKARDGTINQKGDDIAKKDKEIADLKATIAERDAAIAALQAVTVKEEMPDLVKVEHGLDLDQIAETLAPAFKALGLDLHVSPNAGIDDKKDVK